MSRILIQNNIALAPLTTLKVGGAARVFVEAKTEADVLEALSFAGEGNLSVFILGGGSNVLISDDGFDGLVIKVAICGITKKQDEASVLITAGAGENWDDFVKLCVEENLQGLECLSGIPGTVGGTPVQNVGAYGQEVSETIESVRVLERTTGRIFEKSNADCGFAYRTSIFNTTAKDSFIVLNTTFRLKPSGAPKIVYRDLQNFFAEKSPSLQETRNAVLQIRAAKSMVIDENDPNSKSAGSFFKNPIVSIEKYAQIIDVARKMGIESVPKFEVDEESVKIPAAWLIEKSGFYKGYKSENVGLSSKHTLAIVNLGNATAADVLRFKSEIQQKVSETFGIALQAEPVFVGIEQR